MPIVVKAWPKGKLTLSKSDPAYREQRRALAKIRRLRELQKRAVERYEALPFEMGVWHQKPEKRQAGEAVAILGREILRIANGAGLRILAAQLDHNSHDQASTLWLEAGEETLAVLHYHIAKNLQPTSAYLGGTNPPKWTHPRAAEMLARKEETKAKAAATRAAKAADERLCAEAYEAAQRMYALIENPLEVGDPVASKGWGGTYQYEGIVESISPDGWVTLRDYGYYGSSHWGAQRLVKIDLSLAEAPETAICSNCSKVHPVQGRAEEYEACCALPIGSGSRAPTRDRLKYEACCQAMRERDGQAQKRAA